MDFYHQFQVAIAVANLIFFTPISVYKFETITLNPD